MPLSILLLLLSLLPGYAAAAPDPDSDPAAEASQACVVLTAAAERVSLAGHLALYFDPDNRASINELAAAPGRFARLPHGLGLGYPGGSAWLRLTLQRAPGAPAQWWLEVRRPALDEVVLYTPDARGGWRTQALGDNQPWAGRAVRGPTSVFVLDLPEREAQTLYLRIRSSGSLAASLSVWQPAAYFEWGARQMLLYGGFGVAALVIVLISLVQWATLRDRAQLLYAAYVLSLAGLILMVEGVVHFLIAPDEALRLEPLISLAHPLIFTTMALLTREVLQLRQTLPRLDRVYQIAAWAVLTVGVLAVLTGLDTRLKPWLWWAVLVQLPTNGVIAVWLGWQGMRGARLYLLAFGVFILSTLWTLLGVLGLTPNRDWGTNITVLGSLVHMVLMQLTVTERVYAAKRAHDAAREQALLAEQRATARLNQEVDARTADLRRTVDALQLARADLQAALARQTEIALALDQAKQTAEGALADERQLVVMLSHEFRSPLAAIDAATQVLALRQADNPETAPLLERIRRGIGRARHFLDNCLTGDRLDSASMTPRLRPLNPRQLARLAAEDCEPTATPGRIRLRLADDLPASVPGDPELLRILLHNLLGNALKYAPRETEVWLDAGVQGDWLCLAVQDRGPGIPEDEQTLVFRKYHRGRLAGTAPGAGLGLSLVARIAQLHQGQVHLRSSPDTGTRVEVLLPLRPGLPAGSCARPDPAYHADPDPAPVADPDSAPGSDADTGQIPRPTREPKHEHIPS